MNIDEYVPKDQSINAIDMIHTHNDQVTINRAMMAYRFFYPSVYSLDTWDVNRSELEFTPLSWENNIGFWQELSRLVNTEPTYEPYCTMYEELAALGIEKGKPFEPDARMKTILETAAKTANANMRRQFFSDRKPQRIVWKDRLWEMAGVMYNDTILNAPNYRDRYIRDKWLNHAQWESPDIFTRLSGAGFLYCLSTCDSTGNPLSGGLGYQLTIPRPIPARLLWSLTVHDVLTGNELLTDTDKTALSSMFDSSGSSSAAVGILFSPQPPATNDQLWIRTTPGEGWFAYLRLYGPEQAAFDGSWKPGDFEKM